MRRRSSWHLASFAGLILALGTGCKDDNGGKGPIDDDGGFEEDDGGHDGGSNVGKDGGDGGGNPLDAGPDGSADDGGNNGGPDGGEGPDGGPDGGNNGGPDGGSDAGPDAGGSGNPIVSLNSVQFGLAPCGGDAPAGQPFTITNSGTAALTYTVALSNTTAFSIQGAPSGTKSGTIVPSASDSITINAAAVPSSATAGQAIVASATITTNLPAPYNSFSIPLSITPQGAHLALSSAGAPTWLLVQQNEMAAPKTVTILNSGNLAADVTVTEPDEAAFSLKYMNLTASTFSVPAAGNDPGSLALTAGFTPVVIRAYTDEVSLSVDGPVCNGGQAASLTTIPFQGAATGEGLTADIVDALENRVNCGATGTDLPKATIAVKNNSQNNLLIGLSTIAGSQNSPFSLSKNTLNIPSGMSDTFDVSVLAGSAPAGATPGTTLFDTVLIAPQGSSVNPIIRVFSTTVQGAVLTVTAPPAFLNGTNVSPVTQPVTVTNTGNLAASPVFTTGGADSALFAVTLPPSAIPVNDHADVQVTFTPPVGDSTVKNATLVVTPGVGDVICNPAPAPTPITGTASTSGFSLVGSAPVFAPVCPVSGATPGVTTFAAGNQVVTIQNTGNALMKWSAAVDDPTRFAIDLMGTPIANEQHDLAMGATADINVVPAAITFPAVTASDNYGATLTITTDVPGDTPHPIRLAQTAQGAIIGLSGTPLDAFPDTSTKGESSQELLFSLVNSGNVATTVTATSTVGFGSGNAAYYVGNDYAAVGHTAVNTIPLASSNTPVDVTGLFDPVYPDNMLYDENLDLGAKALSTAFTAPGPLCAALPAALPLSTVAKNTISGVSTVAVDFSASPADRQTCGGVRAAKPKTIVVTNYGNEILNIDNVSLDVSGNDFFTVYVNSVGMTTAAVPAAQGGVPGSAVVVVSPKVISDTSSGSHTGTATLTVTTSTINGPTTGSDVLPTIALSNTVVCP